MPAGIPTTYVIGDAGRSTPTAPTTGKSTVSYSIVKRSSRKYRAATVNDEEPADNTDTATVAGSYLAKIASSAAIDLESAPAKAAAVDLMVGHLEEGDDKDTAEVEALALIESAQYEAYIAVVTVYPDGYEASRTWAVSALVLDSVVADNESVTILASGLLWYVDTGGGGNSVLIGRVITKVSGFDYTVAIYPDPSNQVVNYTVTCTQVHLDIDSDDIPGQTIVMVVKIGANYYMQVPIWL